MFRGKAVRSAATVALAASALVAGPVSTATADASQRAAAPRVLTYDAGRSAEFADAVARGAEIWNESVTSVRLRPAASGERANIRVIADNGWPRAVPGRLGNGTVYMGRQAVDQGYNTVRIAAHELGHILGLPDIKPGPCSSLMSGSTAGTACTNPYPDAAERRSVERSFGGGRGAASRPAVYVD